MADEQPEELRLTLPSDPNYLGEARAFVAQVAKEVGLSSSEVHDLLLAVTEAVTNVMEHAYGGDPQQRVEIALSHAGGAFTVVITDYGEGFDEGAHPNPDMPRYLAQRRVGGLGLFLMRRLMDQVEFTSHDGTNQVRMVKHLKG